MNSNLYGILAFPAKHSLSPRMLNAAFRECKINAKYEFFEIPPAELAEFFDQIKTKPITGLSVSIPHKIECQKFLDELDESSQKIGAVNTIFWREKKLIGTNTDWLGAISALETMIPRSELANKKVIVLGSGGSARAIVFGLLQRKAQVRVIARESEKFKNIQKDFNVSGDNIENLTKYSAEILINTTPIGMTGKFENQSLVPLDFLQKQKPLVFDIVYNPLETRFLREAKSTGCQVLSGLEMLVRQGAAQFEVWTGKKAPIEVMRKELNFG
jgi:shikimate dehydrogenase